MQYLSRGVFATTAIALAAMLTGCGSDTTGPRVTTGGTTALSTVQFDSVLSTGPARVELKLRADALVAREVEVEPDDAEEKLISRVTAIDPAAHTVTLEMGGLIVGFDATTRFRTIANSHATEAQWVAAIQTALDAGQQPQIEARRPAPVQPQAPDDASFSASDLRLENTAEDRGMEMYLDGDNFTATPVPTILVLGLSLSVDDSTDLHERHDHGGTPGDSTETGPNDTLPDDGGHGTPGDTTGVTPPPTQGTIVEFKGTVISINVAGGTLTLSSGTIITVGSVTFDPAGDVLSLQAAQDALTAGRIVSAEVLGTVSAAGPPITVAAAALKVETK